MSETETDARCRECGARLPVVEPGWTMEHHPDGGHTAWMIHLPSNATARLAYECRGAASSGVGDVEYNRDLLMRAHEELLRLARIMEPMPTFERVVREGESIPEPGQAPREDVRHG